MNRFISKLPIKIKLIVIIMLPTVISLFLIGATLILYNNHHTKQELIKDLSSIGMLIADRSTAALTFQDSRLAEENLSALNIKPSVVAAFILNDSGAVVAKYTAGEGQTISPPVGFRKSEIRFENGHLMLSKPISLQGKQIGSVIICASLKGLYHQQQNIYLFVIIIIFFTAIIAFFFSSRLHGIVSGPILHLADTAHLISQKTDYSIRASVSSEDEIGTLGKAFNEMLEMINTQNKERKALINDLSESKSMLNTILDTIPQSIFWKDRDGFYLGCNKAFAVSAGLETQDAIIGKTAKDIPWTSERYKEHLVDDQEVLATGRTKYNIMSPHTTAAGKVIWANVTKIPLFDPDGKVALILGILEDITERRNAEEKILNANRVYSVISHINQAIVRTRNRDKLLKELCTIAVEIGKFQMAWVGMVENQTKVVQPFAFAGNEDGYLSKITMISVDDAPMGQGPTGTAIREGRHYVCEDIENDPHMALWREDALQRGYRSSIALPIKLADRVIGSFNLYATRPHFFSEEEIYLLDEVTSNISFALEALETEERRKEVVNTLLKEEEFLSTIFRSMEEGIMACDANGILTRFNQAARVFFGTPEEPISADQWASHYNLYFPDGKTLMRQEDTPLFRALQGEQVHNIEMMIIPKQGIARTLVTSGQNLKDPDGKIIGAVITMHDLTERKKSEEALLKSEGRYRQLLDSITDYIYSVEIENGCPVRTYHQPGCIHVTGYSPSDFYNDQKLWLNIVHPEDQMMVEHYADPLCDGKEIPPIEHRIINKNGNVCWIRNTYVLKHDANGKVTGYDGLISDITERKIVEEELKHYRDHLEELVKLRTAELELEKEHAESADRLKSAFLATMSHELRTPLNSIIGFTGILMQERPGPLNVEQKKQLGMAQNSARHLLSLINDVLDISKIEAGQLVVRLELFNLPEVIQKVVESTRPLAQKKNLELICSISDNVSNIKSDRLRIQQILINLVNNAIKFTETGSIRIEASVKDQYVFLKVIDTGIGIKKEQMDQLFRPFIQIDNGLTRKHEGTGLGLSICKKLLILLNGSIEVESEFGAGSTFSVSLPLNKE